MDAEIELQGRRIPATEMVWLRGWIEGHPPWSRKRLARELCQQWQWVDGRGRLKDFAARSLLLNLEARGVVKLPALRLSQRRPRRGAPTWEAWEEPVAWEASLPEISPIGLERVRPGTEAVRRWRFYLHRYHYLGLAVVGENLGYLARDAQGREVACLLFGAAAWRCAPRDQALGWSQDRDHQLRVPVKDVYVYALKKRRRP